MLPAGVGHAFSVAGANRFFRDLSIVRLRRPAWVLLAFVMMKLHSMRSRLMALTCIGFAVGLIGVTLAGSTLMWQSSRDEAEAAARGLLREYGNSIARDISGAISIARTTATMAKTLAETPVIDRDEMGRLVRGIASDNPELLGVTLVFEPNALDGADDLFVDTPYSDLTGGRFATYAFRDDAGEVAIEKLDMEDETVDVWYGTPLRAGRPVITPAYLDQIEDVPTLITTIAAPVILNDRIVGASGVDIALSDISSMIGALKPFHDGTASLIDDSGQWLASPDAALLGQHADDPTVTSLVEAAMGSGMAEEWDGDIYRAAIPISFAGVAERWILTIAVPQDAMVAGAIAARNIMIVVSIAILIAALVGASWVAALFAKPITIMSGIMGRIAGRELDAQVPFIGRKDEIGGMAEAVDVFRQNALRIEKLTEEEAELQAHANRRAKTMQDFQVEFDAVVAAGLRGDFSARVSTRFDDADISRVAANINALMESIARGLAEAGEVLSAMAHTNLTHRMEGRHEGAFAQLRDDTNAVADSLVSIVRRIRSTSGELRVATGEILSGANDLSERTTRQAATVEQTSASMEQLASTVSENSSRAEAASLEARKASAVADESEAVMQRATAAMADIASSSRKITDIVGLIDDIAFQTNLLALNASVEAARAGDVGKGFAVVAVEVRRLAQSAASAAEDIKRLVEKSGKEVDTGTRLVSEAAAKLLAIRDFVRNNAGHIEGISAASHVQSRAIAEVSVAVRQMDEMTQHNAALVEETNAAIEQTENQASELERLISAFEIGDERPVRRVMQAAE
jgi:methyl-accepting chemotaxis protein